MKSFIKWANSRTWLERIGWVFWLVAIGFCAWYVDVITAVAGYILCLVCMGVSIGHYKRSLTVLLIASLFLSQTPATQSQPPPAPKPLMQQECNPAFIIGGLVIVVGGIIIYKLNQFCKKHFGTPPPPPPPTPPSTNNPNTNNPAFHYNGATLHPSARPTSCDISTNGWLDRTLPSAPVPFQDFLTIAFNSSTDLVTWTNCCSVNLWLSSNSVESVLYDSRGIAVLTNYTAGNPYTQCLTNFLPFPIYDPKTPKLFIRDY